MKVPSVLDRYTPSEREVSGCVAEWRRGPLLLVKARHPARWHRQTMLSNIVNWGWIPFPSRRDGAYREQWMLNRSYLMKWPTDRWSRWCRIHNRPDLQPERFLPWLRWDESGTHRLGLSGWLRSLRAS